MNQLDLLKASIKKYCETGSITDENRKQLYQQANILNISVQDLNYLIETEINQIKNAKLFDDNQTNNSSGFITDNQNEAEKQTLDSGFITDKPNAELIINQNIAEPEFTDITPIRMQGAMSLIQKAKHLGKRWVIIKRLKPEYRNNEQYKNLFFKEFENTFTLEHPHIVRIYGKGHDNEGPYYFMEYVDGRPLSVLIETGETKNEKLVIQIYAQIIDALIYVHKHQIYHRDLKPDNILITFKGDNVKIIDFGLAAADSFDDNLKQAGTPKYAAPELKEKAQTVDQRADIYSAGLILLEMLTCQTQNTDTARIANRTLARIIQKSIKNNISERYLNCTEIKEELAKALEKPIRIPDWFEKKVAEFTSDGTLSPNERKVLEMEAATNGIEPKLLQALIDLELEKARDRLNKQRLLDRQKLLLTDEPKPVQTKNTNYTKWIIGAFIIILAIIFISKGLNNSKNNNLKNQTFTSYQEGTVVYISTGAADLHELASSNSKTIRQLEKGTKLIVLKPMYNWTYVQYEKQKGYVLSTQISNKK